MVPQRATLSDAWIRWKWNLFLVPPAFGNTFDAGAVATVGFLGKVMWRKMYQDDDHVTAGTRNVLRPGHKTECLQRIHCRNAASFQFLLYVFFFGIRMVFVALVSGANPTFSEAGLLLPTSFVVFFFCSSKVNRKREGCRS